MRKEEYYMFGYECGKKDDGESLWDWIASLFTRKEPKWTAYELQTYYEDKIQILLNSGYSEEDAKRLAKIDMECLNR